MIILLEEEKIIKKPEEIML